MSQQIMETMQTERSIMEQIRNHEQAIKDLKKQLHLVKNKDKIAEYIITYNELPQTTVEKYNTLLCSLAANHNGYDFNVLKEKADQCKTTEQIVLAHTLCKARIPVVTILDICPDGWEYQEWHIFNDCLDNFVNSENMENGEYLNINTWKTCKNVSNMLVNENYRLCAMTDPERFEDQNACLRNSAIAWLDEIGE